LTKAAWWGGVFVLLLIVAATGLRFWLDSDNAREWAATKIGSAIHRLVTIKGPVRLAFSLPPTIVIHSLSIAGRSRLSTNVITTDRIEIPIAPLPLVGGSVVIPHLLIDGLDIVLDEELVSELRGSHEKEKQQDHDGKSISATVPIQIHRVTVRRVTLAADLNTSSRVAIASLHEGMVEAFPEQPVRLIASGEYRQVPVSIDATGGTLSDLLGGSESWPVVLSMRAADATLEVDGRVALPLGTPGADVQVTLVGERLSALNRLVAVEWPALGPYSLSCRAKLATGGVAVGNLKAALGTSDLVGEASFRLDQGRPTLSASLTSHKIEPGDFIPPEGAEQVSPRDGERGPSGKLIDWLKNFDANIQMTAGTVMIGDQTLEEVRLETDLQKGLLRFLLHGAQVFGTRFDGHAEYDVAATNPAGSFSVSGHTVDIGMVLRSFGLGDGVLGIADGTFRVTGKGTTWRAVRDSLAMNAHVEDASFLISTPQSENDIQLSLRKGHLSMAGSTAGELVLVGRYGQRPLRVRATTGSLSDFFSDRRWPIRVALHGGRASLNVDGVIDRPLKGEGVALTFQGNAPRLNEWAPSLPAVGPFRLSGNLTGHTPRSWTSSLMGQLGESDLGGRAEMAFDGDHVSISARLTSRLLRAEDFMGRGARVKESGGSTFGHGMNELSLALQRFIADVEWNVDRFRAGRLRLDPGLLRVTVDQGRMEASWSSKANNPGSEAASIRLDMTGIVPDMNVRARFHDVNYGRFLHRWGMTEEVVGKGDVELSLHSAGRTEEELLDHACMDVTARSHAVHVGRSDAAGSGLAVDGAEAKLEVRPKTAMTLSVHGNVRGLPLSLRVTAVPLRQLVDSYHELPLRIVAQGPDVVLEAQGTIGREILRRTANFTVSLKGSSLAHLTPLVQGHMPDLGSYVVTGQVAVRGQKAWLSGLHARVGNSDITGGVEMYWRKPRPRIIGILSSELVEFKTSEQPVAPAAQETETSQPQATGKLAEEAAATAHSIGKEMVQFVDPLQRKRSKAAGEQTRLIPEWVLPVESLRSADLDVQWTVKRLSVPPIELHDVVGMVVLTDGQLRIGPVALTHHGAVTTGLLVVDATREVPHAELEITTTNLDYGGLFKAFKVRDLVEGSADITVTSEGNGRSLRDLLAGVNGRLEIVAGPAKMATRFVELWTSNLMTAMLSQAWHREDVSQYRCAAGSFDLRHGEMRTDGLLIEASDYSLAGAGTLEFATEELDLVITPKPKDLALISLAVPIRLTGPLADPDVSTNAQSIAASKAWQVLNVEDPIGLALQVPRVVFGKPAAFDENPCATALHKRKKGTLSTERIVRTGLQRLTDFWRDAGSAVGRALGRETTVPAR